MCIRDRASVITDEGSKPEILSRVAQTTAALIRLKPVWNYRSIPLSSKIRLMRSERGKKTRQTEEEMGKQHQGMDKPGVRQVPEGSGEPRIRYRQKLGRINLFEQSKQRQNVVKRAQSTVSFVKPRHRRLLPLLCHNSHFDYHTTSLLVRAPTRDRMVASSNPGRSGGRIFFSRANFV